MASALTASIISFTETPPSLYPGSSAYSDNTYSGDIVIPASVTYSDTTYHVSRIGYAAFYGCSGITSVSLPSSLTSIGDDAFYSCTGLTSITIPDSVTSIGNHAFAICSGLTSIVIPNSVTYIGLYAFNNTDLSSVVWNAKNCMDFREHSFSPFDGIGYHITSFTFGNDVEHIPAYLCDGMTNLTSVTLPSKVASIGNYAFCGCNQLSSITSDSSLQAIGDSAFYDCTSVNKMTCYATVAPQAVESSLASISSQAQLYVPAGCKSAYQSDSVWSRFDIREMGEESPTNISELDASSASNSAKKICREGIIYILRAGHLYDITGRLLPPEK